MDIVKVDRTCLMGNKSTEQARSFNLTAVKEEEAAVYLFHYIIPMCGKYVSDNCEF